MDAGTPPCPQAQKASGMRPQQGGKRRDRWGFQPSLAKDKDKDKELALPLIGGGG